MVIRYKYRYICFKCKEEQTGSESNRHGTNCLRGPHSFASAEARCASTLINLSRDPSAIQAASDKATKMAL